MAGMGGGGRRNCAACAVFDRRPSSWRRLSRSGRPEPVSIGTVAGVIMMGYEAGETSVGWEGGGKGREVGGRTITAACGVNSPLRLGGGVSVTAETEACGATSRLTIHNASRPKVRLNSEKCGFLFLRFLLQNKIFYKRPRRTGRAGVQAPKTGGQLKPYRTDCGCTTNRKTAWVHGRLSGYEQSVATTGFSLLWTTGWLSAVWGVTSTRDKVAQKNGAGYGRSTNTNRKPRLLCIMSARLSPKTTTLDAPHFPTLSPIMPSEVNDHASPHLTVLPWKNSVERVFLIPACANSQKQATRARRAFEVGIERNANALAKP